MELNVTSLDSFLTTLSVLQRVVPGAKFVASDKETSVKAINENKTIRIFLETDSLVSSTKEPVEFASNDLLKLQKSLSLLKGTNSFKFNFTGQFLTYTGDCSFKLKTVKPDVIERYVTTDLKTEMKELFAFNISYEKLKSTISNLSIVEEDNSKVYIYVKDGKVRAELDDKKCDMTNSLSVGLADTFTGDPSLVLPLSFENFKLFGLLQSPNIKVSLTNVNVFEVTSEIFDENKKCVKIKIICSLLKG